MLRNKKINIPTELNALLSYETDFIFHDPWNNSDDIEKYNFTFLNVRKGYEKGINWNDKESPLLWTFNLNYFHFLFLLNNKRKNDFCLDWIKNNPVGSTIGWHSYPLSLRIVNWIKNGVEEKEILRSLYVQAEYLYRNLEFYHPANHYLENARALIFAGLYFGNDKKAKRWLEKGLNILMKELKYQVLEDGGYFERTMMYHSLMLELILDLINILPNEYSQKEFFIEKAKLMCDFLQSTTHPNGEISLFNDSTLEIAPNAERILNYALKILEYKPKNKSSFDYSGYYIVSNDNSFLIIDAGKIGPDNIPAHAHADIFSYELSAANNKIIVDSGVYEYQSGEMRDYVRSTKAHNTVRIDKTEQIECWGSFRTARRFAPKNVFFESNKNNTSLVGEFDGYTELIGDKINHTRNFITGNKYIEIIDKIEGSNTHLIESFIHFAPDIKIEIKNNTAVIKRQGSEIVIDFMGGEIELDESFYCPKFGEKYSNYCIVQKAKVELPYTLSYKINL